MNREIFEGQWSQIQIETKVWWGKLTDEDLKRVAGKYDVFVGLLLEKYGYTHERACEVLDMHLTQYETSPRKKIAPK